MGNRRFYKIACFHALGTPKSERLKVAALNLFHPTASPPFRKVGYFHITTQPPRGGDLRSTVNFYVGIWERLAPLQFYQKAGYTGRVPVEWVRSSGMKYLLLQPIFCFNFSVRSEKCSYSICFSGFIVSGRGVPFLQRRTTCFPIPRAIPSSSRTSPFPEVEKS